MSIRNTTIAKLQQLSEPLLQEVSNFIDLVIHKHIFQPGEAKVLVITANGDVVAKVRLKLTWLVGHKCLSLPDPRHLIGFLPSLWHER